MHLYITYIYTETQQRNHYLRGRVNMSFRSRQKLGFNCGLAICLCWAFNKPLDFSDDGFSLYNKYNIIYQIEVSVRIINNTILKCPVECLYPK